MDENTDRNEHRRDQIFEPVERENRRRAPPSRHEEVNQDAIDRDGLPEARETEKAHRLIVRWLAQSLGISNGSSSSATAASRSASASSRSRIVSSRSML